MALKPGQHQAAVLEAQGHKRDDVAQMVGVSPATINNWRKDEEYGTEVERLKSNEVATLESTQIKARRKILEKLPALMQKIDEMMDACDEDGHPKWLIQSKGAEMLMKLILAGGIGNTAVAKDGNADGAPQVAQVVINMGGDTKPKADVDTTAVEE